MRRLPECPPPSSAGLRLSKLLGEHLVSRLLVECQLTRLNTFTGGPMCCMELALERLQVSGSGWSEVLEHVEVTIFQSDSLPRFVPPRTSMPTPAAAAAPVASWLEVIETDCETELCARHCRCLGMKLRRKSQSFRHPRRRHPTAQTWQRLLAGTSVNGNSQPPLRLVGGMQLCLRCPGLAAAGRGERESSNLASVNLGCSMCCLA